MKERFEQTSFLSKSGDIVPVRLPERQIHAIQEAVEPYVDLDALRAYIAEGRDIREALRFDPEHIPAHIAHILDFLKVLLMPSERKQIRSPVDVAGILMLEMGHLQQEQFRTVLLDTKNRVHKIHLLYQGTLDTAHIRVAEVFREAVRINAANMVIAHNHPSNDPTPSPEDILITRQIVEAGNLLDIPILDHLIVSATKYVSMRERGLGFPT